MIGYVTVGSNDLDKARGFYAGLVGALGGSELMRMEENGFTLFGTAWGTPGIAITRPYNGEPATVGNGMMIALAMDARSKVDMLHAKALELGGTCEGKPGLRGPEGDQAFYGAYFRDLDGNKLCAFKVGPAD
ncbi:MULTISPECIES: VOC family protein [Pseudomonadota]|jgi:catechol 2,3-dioxygenase-like lactoylglutathione lyase family enzyme|uniref:VOC family protein n=1 Tax=Pseudomonadota TaxID=1224 RepID=UPI000769B6C0|nr:MULTISPECIES: VOC family protein [Pseudomonadota]MAF61523.1 VOC family protein [Blastomonas sp.]|tara:strand:- start:52771 stop:53166 length:396 start_codon:yes stop_codon:yes gene_type:complete